MKFDHAIFDFEMLHDQRCMRQRLNVARELAECFGVGDVESIFKGMSAEKWGKLGKVLIKARYRIVIWHDWGKIC